MIEITNPFLVILVACSLPLLLVSLIIVPILVTRSRLKEAARMRQNLSQGIFDESLSENKPRFSQRKIVFGLFLAISMFIGLLFMVYWVGEKVGFYNQAYLLGIVAPLACSIPTSALLLLFIHRRIYKK